MKNIRTEKGITLVALVITIIVMLILVGVTITIAFNSGLFEKAREARDNTALARDEEQNLADGKVQIDGKSGEYDIQNIVDNTY